MLRLPQNIYDQMIAHALEGFPLEACGLFAGEVNEPVFVEAESGEWVPAPDTDHTVSLFYPTENEAASAQVYTIPGKAYLQSERDAESRGFQLQGVMHSHTHTDAYPSPTDVRQAPDPTWHYVIVSLRDQLPSLRSYRIIDGEITEEDVIVIDAAGDSQGSS